ncbi:MAG TPA: hypothetical protein VIE65_23755, partial [Methylobacter sp.]
MLETFSEWPAPPYFNFAPGTIKTGPESCIVYFRNGNKALGDLVRFSPGESSIVFLPSRNEVNETINLDKIKSIRLVQPLTMLRQETSLEQRAEEVFAPSERQTFSLEFTDKETISGETVGHTDSANGLYLYLPKDNDKVVRCFIPKQSIGNFQIGMKLGEMLIEEKLASKEDVDAAVTRQRSLRLQRLGDYLSEHQIVTREELDQAIRHQETRPILKLGEALQQLELITQEQLDAALKKQKENRNIPLGQILIEMGIVDERAVKGALAKKLGIPYVGLSKFNFDHNAIRLVNHSLARKHGLIPLCMHENSLVVAFEDPLNLAAVEELRFLIQMKILPVMASHDDVRTAITKHYATHGDNKGHVEFGVDDRIGDDYAYHQSAASEMKIDDLASKLFVED